MKPAALPDEFWLAARCCIWPPGAARDRLVREAAQAPIDWPRFLQTVSRHRIAGLAQDALEDAGLALPDFVASRLAAQAGGIARKAMLLTAESLRLQAMFDAAGIPLLFLKGSALAMLAYGNLTIKHAWDIDVLVRPRDILPASALLERAGYGRIVPSADFVDARFHAWLEIAREALFRNPTRDTYVELHWRLSDNRTHLAHVAADGPSQSVVVAPGRALRTLRDEELFIFLCLHGAHHAWSRVKWLGDLAAWLAQKKPEQVERLYREAQRNQVARAAAQGLLLCEELFALPLAPGLREEMRRDRPTRWLVSVAREAMTGDGMSESTAEHPAGNFKIEASHFLVTPGLRHWLSELSAKSVGWQDFQRFALPRPLFFLYPLLRAPSWLWRRVGTVFRARQVPAATRRAPPS